MESVYQKKPVERKRSRPLDSTQEASSSKKAKMAGRTVTVDEASETKMPCRLMSLDLNNLPNDPLALSPPDKTVVQAETRKKTVERNIDTWMQEETKHNPDNSDQIQSVSQILKERINFVSDVIEGNLNFSNYIHLTSLPKNLTVGGNLNLKGCTSLMSLPENLHINGDLNLEGCTSLTSLPDNFTVSGNLHLRNCTILTSLPDNLTVGENLYIDDCPSLMSLPDNFTVDGNLHLRNCINLTSLPENLTVGGNLHLRNCTILTSLPDNLTVGGNLYLNSCISLVSLPENLHVNEYLCLRNCISLVSLPENLHVSGCMDLEGCTSLTSLPNNLTVDKYLNLKGSTSLTSLPENFHVNGYLCLLNCTSLTSLPENLTVDGNLYLKNCTSLMSLSENLTVSRNLDLSNCTSLMSLPENLTVGENLNLSGCTNLTSLPENLHVSGGLNLEGCTNLMPLPENLTVGGNLDLRDCTSLTFLPENLTVNGNLYLRNCTSLTSMPDNFTVNGELDLCGCASLTSLPENLTVGENLNFRDCTSLTSLPNNITAMGLTASGYVREVSFEGGGLSLEIIQRLQQIQDDGSAPDMQFIFSMPGTQSQITFSSIAKGFDCWRKLTDVENFTCPNLEKLTPDETVNLCRFLTRLIDTAEYKNVNTRPGLARRVLYFLAEIEKNEELREVACQLIYDGLTSCDDRTILALDDINLSMEINAAEKEVIDSNDASGTALKALAKQIIMLEKVDKAANEHIKSLSFVDPIEVKLAFRLRLKEKLNLPISTQHMIFRSCAYITDEEIDAVGDKILQEYYEPELEIFLRSWSPWKQHERSQDVTLYEILPEVYDEDLNIDINTKCAITLGTPDYPVLFEHIKYEYAALKKHYIYNGKNPLTNEPMLWRDVKKIVSTKT